MDFIYFAIGGLTGALSVALYAWNAYGKGYDQGYDDAEEELTKNIREVAKLVKMRASIYFCSYRSAWNNCMTEEERQGFTFEEVYEEILK